MSDADLLEQIVQEIDARLRAAGSPERADQQRAYLKSSLEFYGVAVPVLRREVLAVLAAQALGSPIAVTRAHGRTSRSACIPPR